jgi:hypothetical protein
MQTIQKARLRSGQFAPGQSGNPGGRPKDEHRVAELARSYTLEAIDTLVELMRDGKDERVRGTAAQALLDRGWGKAKVEVVTGAEGSYLDVLRVVNEEHACQAQWNAKLRGKLECKASVWLLFC